MKWYILLTVSFGGEEAKFPPAFFGKIACERAIHELVEMGFKGQAKCTPRRIK